MSGWTRYAHRMESTISWEAYVLAFLAVAGWVHERKIGRLGGDWVDVAQQACSHGTWRWTMEGSDQWLVL